MAAAGELFERLERVERAALAAFHEAASPESRQALGLRLESLDGVLISIAAADPGIVTNRALGLGTSAPARRELVDALVDAYADLDVERYYVHVQPRARPPELEGWLRDAGLVEQRGWMQFTRDTSPPPTLQSDLRVEQIGADHGGAFGRIAAAGFGLDQAAAAVLAGLVGHRHWNVYLTFDGDEPAGCGAMFVHDDVAWFDWAATRPEFRRRGSQGRLLCRRIRDAVDMGCELMATETGEAVEGDPQHSYGNILKVGFREEQLRKNFGPTGGGNR